jgi:hypothetical protein
MLHKRDRQAGSVILPTLLIIMVIVGVGSTYLTLSFSEFKMANRNADLQSSINLAEAGIEEAMVSIRNGDWSTTGWTSVVTDHYYQNFPNVYLGNGRVGEIKVYASVLDSSAPIIFAEGRIISDYGNIRKQIRLDLEKKGLFANGLTAKNEVTFNGNQIAIDSYDSTAGAYNVNSNRNDKGSVGSIAVTQDAVTIGNADIWGYVATGGGDPDIGSQGSVLGDDSPVGIKVDWDRIALDFYAEFENISAPSPGAFPINLLPQNGTIGTATATTPTDYTIGSYSNSSSDTLTIDGPVVIIATGDISTKGTIQLTANGSVEFYVAGNVDIGGNGIVNSTNVPSKMLIFGTNTVQGSKNITISGNGALKGAIYAPNANLELKGSGSAGEFMGAAVANNIKMTGNFEFHYDEALDSFSIDKNYKISRWRELIWSDEKVPLDSPSDMTPYAVSVSTQPAFTQPSNL